MKQKIPKIISIAFCLQIALFCISLLILGSTEGLTSLLAVYTLIPTVVLVPIIAILAVFFPFKEWRSHGSALVAAALIVNVPAALIIFIRFVVMSFVLHIR